MGLLKVLNNFKLISNESEWSLDHLAWIWYHWKSVGVPCSSNKQLVYQPFLRKLDFKLFSWGTVGKQNHNAVQNFFQCRSNVKLWALRHMYEISNQFKLNELRKPCCWYGRARSTNQSTLMSSCQLSDIYTTGLHWWHHLLTDLENKL